MSAPAHLRDSADAAEHAHGEDALAQTLLNHAERSLQAGEPSLLGFFQTLYRNAAAEDIDRFQPEALVALARLVHERAQKRPPHESIIELFEPHELSRDYPAVESVLLAVNDDMPFLFDSLVGEIANQGLRPRAVFHPIVTLNGQTTSIIVLVVDPVIGEERRRAVLGGAKMVLGQVRVAVRDWHGMMARLHESIDRLKDHPPQINPIELAEDIAFLEWLSANHFTMLGCRDYVFVGKNGGRLDPMIGSGLGVLADDEARVLRRGPDRGRLTPEVRAFLTMPSPLIITKSSERSHVHRRVHMDYVGVKIFDENGALLGERRFVGLFTSGAYSSQPSEIPLLRRKVAHVIERAGLAPNSHDSKALTHILDTFPRDELFQISVDDLFATSMGILKLGERPKVKLFVRFDRFDRFVSILAFVPRDRYDTIIRERIHALFAKAFDGRMSAAMPTIEDSPLARVHFIVGRNEGERPFVKVHELERQVRAAIRTWDDRLLLALIAAHGEQAGREIYQDGSATFSPGYRGVFSPETAVEDLKEFETLEGEEKARLHARVYRREDDAHNVLRLKLYLLGDVLPLSVSMPIFENLGLRVIAEDSFPLTLKHKGWNRDAVVLDFVMERADDGPAHLADIKTPLEDAFHAIIAGSAESDGFNKLVIAAGLAWRDITILRAGAKFLRQTGITFSQDYMEHALSHNPDIATLLVALFHARNDPAHANEAAVAELNRRLDAALGDVPSLDDDRIIRRLRNVIDCVLRTNFYQPAEGGGSKPYLAMKLDSHRLDELPAPRPLVEIFVYAPDVEGVHLRFGKVARGGIRWSDRREDFRTEILGLVKAQQVKNAVIVPVGAKGGFYPKRLPVNATREAVQEAGVAAYKILINAMLDVTDNLHHDGSVVPPPSLLRHDGDDPYLVVAADKGTATFSDIANGIAEQRGFWLGDAFASGGSHGYDHKKMGITARGAWEAVKRHFREVGMDIQTTPFSVVGVGDMSGDVFGNGMLLSKKTKLVAAFDHRHIFIDPDPDTEKSWTERKRMFELPRSSWDDYNKSLISKGGGIFPRTAKEIAITPEIAALTGTTKDKVSPAELIKALLKAQVDLIFFGGIGTFIKARTQSHLDVGDRTNDALRIDGADVRAKVIGEGANLGATQLGRVEYARAGGRINTDAVDNSAGVDTSDHEVNLKILLSGPLRRGDLAPEARDKLLNDMTDDVAAHVLKDNYDQTLALSVAQSRATNDLDAHGRFMRDLEARGKLDRGVEFLPDDVEMRLRAQRDLGLTRPELAVLLAYAKLDLDAEIVASDLPDDRAFVSTLTGYFPPAAVARFPDEIGQHRLRREIISTCLANRIVNLAGPVFISRMKEMSGAPGARVARAFVVAEGAFGLSALRTRIDALDAAVKADIQTGMYTDIAEILRRLGLWFITNVPVAADLAETIALYRAGVEALRGTFASLVSPFEGQIVEARIESLKSAGVSHDVAEDVAVLPLMSGTPEIALLAHTRSLNVDLVAGAYFGIGAAVGIDRVRSLAQRIPAVEHWDRLAIRRIVDDLFAGQRALTADALGLLNGSGQTRKDGAEAAKAWAAQHADQLERARSFLTALEQAGELSVAKLTLANSQIRELSAR